MGQRVAHLVVRRRHAEPGTAGQGGETFLRQAQHAAFEHLAIEARNEEGLVAQAQRRVDPQAQMARDAHVWRLMAQDRCKARIGATTELDDEVFGGVAVGERVVDIQKPVAGARQQQLRPLALHTGGARDEKTVRGQVVNEAVGTLCDLFVGETLARSGMASQPCGRFLDAQVADRIAVNGCRNPPATGASPRWPPVFPAGSTGAAIRRVQSLAAACRSTLPANGRMPALQARPEIGSTRPMRRARLDGP